MSMVDDVRLSDRLRSMYDDMCEQYDEAIQNDNAPAAERLTRVIRDLAKQIKDHEIHERETIPRKEIVRTWNLLAVMIGKRLKERDGQLLDASELLVDLKLDGDALIEAELNAY